MYVYMHQVVHIYVWAYLLYYFAFNINILTDQHLLVNMIPFPASPLLHAQKQPILD